VSTLFEAAPTGPDSRPAPYLVWLRALPGGIELSLPPTTRSRIDATAASAARVLLGHDVMSDHPGGVRAAVQETALVLLTGVERDEVAALGLLFIDPETGATVLEVPAERTQVAETPPGDMPLVYLAGNAGVNFEIEKVPWDKLLEVDAARKWVVWGLIDDLDRVVAMTPEAVAEYVLPKPDPETSLMPPSWRGKTDSTEGSRGSRTQPFAGRSRFKRFVKSLDAFLALTGPELRLVRMRRREAELKLCTSDELRRLLRKRNRRGGTNAPRKS
jgi:hypothetical protein